MRLADLLAPEDVLPDLRASGKRQLLAELAAHAGRRVGVAPDTLLGALLRREELGSTGTGDGIAIPHTRLPETSIPAGVFARLRKPIDFEAVDGRPVDLVFLLVLPAGEGGQQLNALACVARKLRDPAVAAALRSTRERDAVRELLVTDRLGVVLP